MLFCKSEIKLIYCFFVCVQHEIFKLSNMKTILNLGGENDGRHRCRRFWVITPVYPNVQKNKNVVIAVSISKLIRAECHEV